MERFYALMESTRSDSEDAFFSARPKLDEPANHGYFRHGFDRGFRAAYDLLQGQSLTVETTPALPHALGGVCGVCHETTAHKPNCPYAR